MRAGYFSLNVFLLSSVTQDLVSFLVCNHSAKKERAGYLTLKVSSLSSAMLDFVSFPVLQPFR